MENLFEFWTEEVRQWGSQGLINEAELDDLSDILNIKIIKECFMKKKDFSVASEKKEHILGSISQLEDDLKEYKRRAQVGEATESFFKEIKRIMG